MLLTENLKLALVAIKSNKMRSFLTMLGIIIGISSVIAITAIGSSMQAMLNKQFDGVGKDRMVIFPNYNLDIAMTENDYFDLDDIERLKTKFKEDIMYIAPAVAGKSSIRGEKKALDVNLTGVAENAEPFLQIEMMEGRLINENDVLGKKSNIVINNELAEKLFRTTKVVGEKIAISNVDGNDLDMTIVGVYKLPEDNLFMGMSMGSNYTGYIPYSLYSSQVEFMYQLDFFTKPGLDFQKLGQKMSDFMATTKGREPGFYMFESTELQKDMINSMLDTLSLAIGCIAGISLLVGGIGIMNIMLVSVTERTREIGIRKSLGARTRDILQQFLIESMLLSVMGGIIGLGLGLGLAGIGGVVANVDIVINPGAVIFAIIFSGAVGIFFGIYPAKKAARLDPIDALRYE